MSGQVCCIVLQCVAVCCSVLQRVTVCCSVLQCVAVLPESRNLESCLRVKVLPFQSHRYVLQKKLSPYHMTLCLVSITFIIFSCLHNTVIIDLTCRRGSVGVNP